MKFQQDKAHRTAISRKTLSQPMKFLEKSGLLVGKNKLDYGCGRGFDADYLGFDKYDYYFFPKFPKKKYNLIVCNYVLNVVDKKTEFSILMNIYNLLKNEGIAYISVRRDIKNNFTTSRGTYQRLVYLDLPILKENSDFCIYIMGKID